MNCQNNTEFQEQETASDDMNDEDDRNKGNGINEMVHLWVYKKRITIKRKTNQRRYIDHRQVEALVTILMFTLGVMVIQIKING